MAGGVALRELSLHLLDLLENSVRAGARNVRVEITELHDRNVLELVVDDDGHGLRTSVEKVLDPFYTTKGGKRTGLGLPLLRATAEAAGGRLSLGRSESGGVRVEAWLQLDHVDWVPLGDLETTLSTLACTTPEVDFCCALRVGERAVEISVEQVRLALGDCGDDPIAVSLELAEGIREGQRALGMKA